MTHLLFNEMESQEHLMLMEAEYAMKSLKAEFDGQAKYIDSNIKLYGEAFGAGIAIAALIKTGIALLVKFFIAFKGIIVAVVTSIIAYLAKRKMGKRVDVGGGGGGGGSVASAGTTVKPTDVLKDTDKKAIKSMLDKVMKEGNFKLVDPELVDAIDSLSGDNINTLVEMITGLSSEQMEKLNNNMGDIRINIDEISDNYVLLPEGFIGSDKFTEDLILASLYDDVSATNSILKSNPLYFINENKSFLENQKKLMDISVFRNNNIDNYMNIKAMMSILLTNPVSMSVLNTGALSVLIGFLSDIKSLNNEDMKDIYSTLKDVPKEIYDVIDEKKLKSVMESEFKKLFVSQKDTPETLMQTLIKALNMVISPSVIDLGLDKESITSGNWDVGNMLRRVELAKEGVAKLDNELVTITDINDIRVSIVSVPENNNIKHISILPKNVESKSMYDVSRVGELVLRDTKDIKNIDLGDFKKYCDASANISKKISDVVGDTGKNEGDLIRYTLRLTSDLSSMLMSLTNITSKLTRQVNHPLNKKCTMEFIKLSAIRETIVSGKNNIIPL